MCVLAGYPSTTLITTSCSAPQPYPDQQVAPGVYTRPPPSPPISSNVPQRANALLSLLNTARAATREGDFDTALAAYTQGVRQYPDLALSEYARLGRAMLLYQLGDTSQALLELEDCEVSMKGYAEVHAALAAVLYAGVSVVDIAVAPIYILWHTEKPAQLARAELQWEVASSFDTRYSDVGWVANEKCWPPKLALALNRFLTLS